MSIKNRVRGKVSRTFLKAQKHSPVILLGAGVVGFVATTVLACRATVKMSETLDGIEAAKAEHEGTTYENEKEATKALTRIQLNGAIEIARLYAPAVILGGLSIVALTTSHKVLNKRYVGVTAAYTALDQAYREYQERVKAELGPEKEVELRHNLVDKKIAVETDTGMDVTTVKAASSKGLSLYAKCFDETNANWQDVKLDPHHNRSFIANMQVFANEKLRHNRHLFLNEVYDMLGMERQPYGQSVGWLADEGDGYVSFGVYDGNTLMGEHFVMGEEGSIWLDFNVIGPIWDKI